MKTITLRRDDETDRDLHEFCDAVGMNITTFFTIYAKKVLRERKIPFDLDVPDPFYSASNMAALREADKQVKEGKTVTRTMSELEAMADA